MAIHKHCVVNDIRIITSLKLKPWEVNMTHRKGEFNEFWNHFFSGRNINCFTPHRHLSLFSNASFHCHGVQRSFTSSSSDGSKDPQNGKNGKEMNINQQKDPKVTQEANGSTAGSSGDPEKKLSVFQRFKQTYKEHGKVLIIVEVVTSIFWYGLFYFIVTW